MSKLRKFVLVSLAAAGLSIASVSVLANRENSSPIEHGPGQVVGRMEKRLATLHETFAAQQQAASKAQSGKAKSAPGNQSDWSELFGSAR
jgi:cell shape-determining protein MreC